MTMKDAEIIKAWLTAKIDHCRKVAHDNSHPSIVSFSDKMAHLELFVKRAKCFQTALDALQMDIDAGKFKTEENDDEQTPTT